MTWSFFSLWVTRTRVSTESRDSSQNFVSLHLFTTSTLPPPLYNSGRSENIESSSHRQTTWNYCVWTTCQTWVHEHLSLLCVPVPSQYSTVLVCRRNMLITSKEKGNVLLEMVENLMTVKIKNLHTLCLYVSTCGSPSFITGVFDHLSLDVMYRSICDT